MDSKQLWEIRSNLELLPVLQRREQRIKSNIRDATNKQEELLNRYEKEKFDVEKLEKDTLSVFLLKTFARYVEKREKEIKEMAEAKVQYDEAAHRVEQLKHEHLELRRRIVGLHKQQDVYNEVLKQRGEKLEQSGTGSYASQYIQLKERISAVTAQICESNEALSSIACAIETAREALKWVKKAKTWSGWDAFGGGGIITHTMKYDRIDEAERCYFNLNHQLQNVRQELEDIDMTVGFEFTMLSESTRILDYWFDNIFTDMRVLDKLETDYDHIEKLLGVLLGTKHKVSTHLDNLTQSQTELQQRIENILISM